MVAPLRGMVAPLRGVVAPPRGVVAPLREVVGQEWEGLPREEMAEGIKVVQAEEEWLPILRQT
jgi:hypothetical protein